jgi:uroporphyrin-III C-methyltransferase
MNESGIVYLVGAGPGDPELISLKGVKCLQKADVVIYDRLVNGELLAYPPPGAELIYVGKEPEYPQVSTGKISIDSSPPGRTPAAQNDKQHLLQERPPVDRDGRRSRITQEEIHALMVARARQGKTVVRLKGGDPFVFGRGGEECLALAEAGIPFEVIPGISSAMAAPAYAGIPVTHRGVSQSFTVVTGHTCGEQPCEVEWEDLPRSGTLVILMGVQNLPQIAARLVQSGRSAETPAAVIHWGTTEAQVVVSGRLADLAEKSRGIRPPAVIVVGEVVELKEQMNWFAPGLYRYQAAASLPASIAE